MNIIISVYFSINCLIAGFYLADEVKWQREKPDKIYTLGIFILAIFFAVPWLLLSFGFEVFKRYFWDLFQFGFFFTYVFTKKFKALEEEKLDAMHVLTKKHFNKNTLRHRIYRYCTRLVEKRNNYEPKRDS